MASKVVEEKIVKFGIDDDQFRKGLKSAAEGLKGMSTALDGMSQGDRLSAIGKSMSALGNGVQETSQRFSALGMAATIALGNILTKAISTGAHMVKALSLDPLMSGFNMYEARINSVNMLTAALESKYAGNTKQLSADIQGALKSLQDYAQTTKYEVGQMHSSLAQFVNAGVGLTDATAALKGWGNLAASAGASTQAFANSLQFGVQQALQMGVMTTQNWMSVENAGMATEKFKNALLDNAKAMGKNVDASKSFRESLSDKWLTNDVLIKTLNDLANDNSLVEMASKFHTFGEAADAVKEGVVASWSNFWEELLGKAGSQEVTDFWTKYGNMAADATTKAADGATNLAKKFVELGGRQKMLDALSKAVLTLGDIMRAIGKAWREVFPKSTEDTAKSLVGTFDSLKNHMHLTKKAIDSVEGGFKLLFTILKAGLTVFGVVADAIELLIPDRLVEMILLTGKTIINIFAGIGNGFKKLLPDVDTSPIAKGWKELGDIIHSINDKIYSFIESFYDISEKWKDHSSEMIADFVKAHPVIGKVAEAIQWVAEQFGKLFKMVGNLHIFDKLSNVFGGIGDAAKKMFDRIADSGIANKLSEMFNKVGDNAKKVFETIASSPLGSKVSQAFSGIGDAAKRVFDQIANSGAASQAWSWIKDLWSWLSDKLGPAFKFVGDKAKDFGTAILNLKPNFSGLIPSADSLYKGMSNIMEVLTHPFGQTAYADTLSRTDNETKNNAKSTKTWGDVLKALANFWIGVSNAILRFFTPAIEAAKHVISETWKYIQDSGLWQRFINYMTGAGDGVNRLKLVFEALVGILTGKFVPVLSSIAQFFLGSKVSADEVTNSVKKSSDTVETASNHYATFSDYLKKMKDYAHDFFSGITSDADAFLKGAAVVGILAFILKLKSGKGLLTDIKDSISNFFGVFTLGSNVNHVLNSTAHAIDSFANAQRAAMLHSIGLALLEVSGAMMIMSMIPGDKVSQVLLLLAAGVTALATAMLVINHAKNAGGALKQGASKTGGQAASGLLSGVLADLGFPEMKKLLSSIAKATTMLSLVISVGIILKEIDTFSKMDLDKMKKGIIMVGGAMAVLVAVMQSMRGIKVSMGSALMPLALVGAIWLLIKEIQKVANIPISTIKAGGTIVAGVAAFLLGAMVILNKFGGGISASAMLAPMSIAVAVKIMISSILAIVNKTHGVSISTVNQVAGIVETITAVLAVSVAAIGRLGGSSIPKGATVAILAISVGVKVMVSAMVDLATHTANISVATLDHIAITIDAMMVVLTGCVVALSRFGAQGVPKTTLVAIAELIIGVKVMADQVINLAGLDMGSMTTASLMIDLMLAIVTGSLWAISQIKFEGTDLGAMALAIGEIFVIGGVLTQFASLSLAEAAIAVGTLSTTLFAVAGAMAVMSNLNWDLTSLGAVVAAIGLVLGLGYTLQELANIPWEKLTAAALSLSGTMLALSGAMAIISATSTGAGVAGLLGLSVAVLALAGGLMLLSSISLADMGVALLGLGAGMAILIAAGAGAEAVAPGMIVLAATLVAIGVAALGIGAGLLMASEAFQNFYDLFSQIFNDISSIDVGTIFQGIIDGITGFFSNIGSTLSGIGSNIVGALGSGISGAGGIVSGAASAVWNGAQSVWDGAKGIVGSIGSGIGSLFSGGIRGAQGLASSAGSAVSGAVTGIWNGAKGVVGGIGSAIGGLFSNGVGNKSGDARGAGTKVIDAVKKVLDVGQELFDAGKKIIGRFIDGIGSMISAAGKKVGEVIDAVKSFLPHSPAKKGPLTKPGWDRLKGSGAALIERFVEGIDEGGRGAVDAMENLMTDLNDALNSEQNNGTFDPTIKPKVDLSNLNRADIDRALGIQNGQIGTAVINQGALSLAAATNQNQDILDGMQTLNERLTDLAEINERQRELLDKRQVVNTYLDGDLMNKKLAPGMTDAQSDYQSRMNRLGGIFE